MAANEPIPINVYSKTETDLKLELLSKSMEKGFDRLEVLIQGNKVDIQSVKTGLEAQIHSVKTELETTMKSDKAELNHRMDILSQQVQLLLWITGSALIGLGSILATVCLKVFHVF